MNAHQLKSMIDQYHNSKGMLRKYGGKLYPAYSHSMQIIAEVLHSIPDNRRDQPLLPTDIKKIETAISLLDAYSNSCTRRVFIQRKAELLSNVNKEVEISCEIFIRKKIATVRADAALTNAMFRGDYKEINEAENKLRECVKQEVGANNDLCQLCVKQCCLEAKLVEGEQWELERDTLVRGRVDRLFEKVLQEESEKKERKIPRYKGPKF